MAVGFWQEAEGAFAALTDDLSDDTLKAAMKLPAASSLKGITGDTFATNDWDIVFLDGVPMPGICDVRGVPELRVDDKKAPGKHGATFTITGYQPGPFEIVCTIWTPDQWDQLQAIIDQVWNVPRLDKKPVAALRKARTVSHPKLTAVNIDLCVVRGIALPEDGPVTGSKVIRFKCQEVKPPGKKNATATPKGGPGRVAEYQSGSEPKNAAPAPPSKNPKNLRPGGPPTPPAGGGF